MKSFFPKLIVLSAVAFAVSSNFLTYGANCSHSPTTCAKACSNFTGIEVTSSPDEHPTSGTSHKTVAHSYNGELFQFNGATPCGKRVGKSCQSLTTTGCGGGGS